MIRSMSGHGRATASSEHLRVTVEVRTVNHRFQRVSLRLPGELSFLEQEVRRQVLAAVERGKVDLTATVEGVGSGTARIDFDETRRWVQELRTLEREMEIVATPVMADLLALPGVLVAGGPAPDPEEAARLGRQAVGEALEALDDMRRREGADLAADLRVRAATLSAGLDRIVAVAEELPRRVRDALLERMTELLEDMSVPVDATRLAQEAAYHAERADITEEVVRLRSHLEKVERLLESVEPVGRTLEFVVQEVHRELNTIGAKTKDLAVIDDVLALKSELERIREQVQNIE